MELQTILLFVVLFLIAVVVLVVVFKYGMVEKSYEEALAEQRQQSHVFVSAKSKSKDKKAKKSKKSEGHPVKTKKAVDDEHKHVEFKEAVEQVPAVLPPVTQKQTKAEKVKPILVNKEEKPVEVAAKPAEVVNNFVKIHPKDDVELVKAAAAEEQEQTKCDVSTVTAQKPANKKKQPEASIATNEKVVNKRAAGSASVDKQVNKKQHNETVEKAATNNHQERTGEGSAPKEGLKEKEKMNVVVAPPSTANGLISNVGKEKKKKKSEYNTVQQLVGDANGPPVSLLLNLVRKAELSHPDIQILIDLLLNKQHEAPDTLAEWTEGKSDPVQKLKKQLADKERMLEEEQQTLLGVQAKMRELRTENHEERAKFQLKLRQVEEAFNARQAEVVRVHQQQVQQLQAQLKDEMVKTHQLREEMGALQMQRQQYDIRLAQVQETEVMIGQLRNDVQELSAVNNQLRMELNRVTDEEKDRQQSFIHQLTSFQKELEQKSERNRQLEEGRIEMERNMDQFLKQECDLKSEIARLGSILQQQNEELRRLEHSKLQVLDEQHQHQEETTRLIVQLRNELEKAEEEKAHMQKSQLNGTLQETKQHELEIMNLHNELSSLKNLLGQSRNEFESATKTVQHLQEELDSERAKVEEQKLKNNELRTKNWKVVEALNAAETRINNKSVKFSNSVPIEFVQRLFPEIKELASIKEERFESECEPLIQQYLSNLREEHSKQVAKDSPSEEVQQLKSQLQQYKHVIDETEKMLNQLQKQIEQQEIDWHVRLTESQSELETVRNNSNSQVSHLEEQLREEQDARKRLTSELETLRNGATSLETCNGLH